MGGGTVRRWELTDEVLTEALTYLLHVMRDPPRHLNEVRVDIAKFLVAVLAGPDHWRPSMAPTDRTTIVQRGEHHGQAVADSTHPFLTGDRRLDGLGRSGARKPAG